MKDLIQLERYRVALPPGVCELWGVPPFGGNLASICGAFVVGSPIDKKALRIIASNEAGWDHISVSRANRCPTWAEMEHVKRLFFKDDEVAMQLHVKPSEHISYHPFCLHLWRPHKVPIPLPPTDMV